MKYYFIVLAITLCLTTTAQDCTTASLLQRPGTWHQYSQSAGGGTAAELLKEKKVVAAIHTMISSKYIPMGLQANYVGVYHPSYPNMCGNSYYYSITPLNFYCDGNSVKIEHETGSLLHIAANMFDAEIYDTAQGDRLLLECFNVMHDLPIQKDDYWFFKEINISLGMGVTGKRGMWLITYDGKLPYAYVTRKEFLEKRIIAITAMQEMSASGFRDALKNIDIEKSFKEKEVKNDAAKMSEYMKNDYLPRKAKYEKQLANNSTTYAPAFAAIATQLKRPDTELSQPAIVKIDPNQTFNYLFTTDDDPFGLILIKPNPSYFNKKLPKSSPQFFMVYVTADDKDPVAAKFMGDVIKAVDFNMLKNMLGK